MKVRTEKDNDQSMCVTIIKYLFTGLMVLGLIQYIITGDKGGGPPPSSKAKGPSKA